jgi:hypothetical protein
MHTPSTRTLSRWRMTAARNTSGRSKTPGLCCVLGGGIACVWPKPHTHATVWGTDRQRPKALETPRTSRPSEVGPRSSRCHSLGQAGRASAATYGKAKLLVWSCPHVLSPGGVASARSSTKPRACRSSGRLRCRVRRCQWRPSSRCEPRLDSREIGAVPMLRARR